jgi:phosphinothricin acetyltransferase
MKIRALQPADWPAVKTIYEEGIATRNATFETKAPEWESWDASHRPDARFVAEDETGKLCGWAALTPVSGRCVYAGVAEVSVYISESSRGMGVGRLLLSQLVETSELLGLWTLQAGVFPENTASLTLHERLGFRLIGRRERIGQMKDGQWRDTILLERRSQVVGQSNFAHT